MFRTVREVAEVAGHCLYQAFRHPLRQITQLANPEPIKLSPIPWWGCGSIILVGIMSWVFSSLYQIEGLDEASRAMVYLPLMHLFDMSVAVRNQINRRR